ncbi:MAG: hypothetical protein QM791_12865 [Ferruginibacter sp.]
MGIQFQSLFTLQVLHDYYSMHDNRCPDFSIIPSSDTMQQMTNQRMLHKNYSNKLFVVCGAEKIDNSNPPPASRQVPFVKLPAEMILRFYLVLNNKSFNNFTAVTPQEQRKVFYFSNLSKNKSGTVLSLSDSSPVFNATKLYLPGAIVKNADGDLFESVRISDGTPASKDLLDTDYWIQTPGNNPYVNVNSIISVTGGVYSYKLQTPAKDIDIKIFSLDRSGPDAVYSTVEKSVKRSYPQNQESIVVDFSAFRPGRYRLVVNGEPEVWIYVDPAVLRQSVFGIIEIHHYEKLPADFNLLEDNRYLKTPEQLFTVWFKNRSVIWKYTSQSGDAIGINDDSAAPQVFVPASGTLVKSKKAIALKEEVNDKLKATVTASGREIKKLRNPDIDKLVFEKENDTGFFTSNIYIQVT